MKSRSWTGAFVSLAFALLALAGLGMASADDVNWPAWRGADGSGVSSEDGLPTAWDESTNVAWMTPIPGRAHSSPIVWGDQVFVTTAIAGDPIPGHEPRPHLFGGQPFRHPDATDGNLRHTYQLLSIDAASGRILWTETVYEGPVADDRHRRGSYAAHTPATDGERVYAYFGAEGIFAYGLDGRQLWKRVLGDTVGESVGLGTSPILYDGLVIVQADTDEGDGSFLVALDAATGADVWRVDRTTSVTWATPVIVDEGNRPSLVTSGNEQIIAYDPQTGEERWRQAGLQSNAIPSPVVAGEYVILSTGYPQKRTRAYRLDDAPDGSRLVWEYEKGTAYVPSPIVYGDYLYLTTDSGILTCLDARTGAVIYEGGRPPVPATFMSSPVAFGGYLFMTSEDGDTFVITAGPDYDVVRTNSVGEPVFASLAAAGGTVYVRGERHLFAIR